MSNNVIPFDPYRIRRGEDDDPEPPQFYGRVDQVLEDAEIEGAIRKGEIANDVWLFPDQKRAVIKVIKAMNDGERYIKIEGFGGTGKSTCCAVLVTAMKHLRLLVGPKPIAIASATHVATNNIKDKLKNTGVSTVGKTLAGWLLRRQLFETRASRKATKELEKEVANGMSRQSHQYQKRLIYIEGLMNERYALADHDGELSDAKAIYSLMIIDEYTLAKSKHRWWFDKYARNLPILLLGDSFQLILPDDDDDEDFGDDFMPLFPTAKLTVPRRAEKTNLPSFLATLRYGPRGINDGREAGGALHISRFSEAALDDPAFYQHLINNGYEVAVTWTHDERRRVSRGLRFEVTGLTEELPKFGEPLTVRSGNRDSGITSGSRLTVGEDIFIDDSFLAAYQALADELKCKVEWDKLVPIAITSRKALQRLGWARRIDDAIIWPGFIPRDFLNWLMEYGRVNSNDFKKAKASAKADLSDIVNLMTKITMLKANGGGKDIPDILAHPVLLAAEYGYCLTLHSCQGTEFDNLCVIYHGVTPDPGMETMTDGLTNDGYSGRKWLYTGISRAKEKCRLIITDGRMCRDTGNKETWQQMADRLGIQLPAGMADTGDE